MQFAGAQAECRQFALHVTGQLAAATADQLAASVGETRQVLSGLEERRGVSAGLCVTARGGVLLQLIQGSADFAFGLQQQTLRVARQLAGGEQIAGDELAELFQARAQVVRQVWRQFAELRGQRLDGLLGLLVAQGVAAAQVGLDVVRDLVLKLL